MAQNIAIIGSDINGAIANAAKFANCGAKVTLYLRDSELQDCDVVALTTNSKHVSARRACSIKPEMLLESVMAGISTCMKIPRYEVTCLPASRQ